MQFFVTVKVPVMKFDDTFWNFLHQVKVRNKWITQHRKRVSLNHRLGSIMYFVILILDTHSSHEKFNTLHHSKREEFLLRGSPLIFLLLKIFER